MQAAPEIPSATSSRFFFHARQLIGTATQMLRQSKQSINLPIIPFPKRARTRARMSPGPSSLASRCVIRHVAKLARMKRSHALLSLMLWSICRRQIVADAHSPGRRQLAVESACKAVAPGLILHVELKCLAAALSPLQCEARWWPEHRGETRIESADGIEYTQVELRQEAMELRWVWWDRAAREVLLTAFPRVAHALYSPERVGSEGWRTERRGDGNCVSGTTLASHRDGIEVEVVAGIGHIGTIDELVICDSHNFHGPTCTARHALWDELAQVQIGAVRQTFQATEFGGDGLVVEPYALRIIVVVS